MIKGAIKDNKRRYQLWRIWNKDQPLLLYILLNPSYADANADDRTVLKLINFTKKFGYGGFYLGNLHSYITPYPKILKDKILADDTTTVKHLNRMKKKCKKVVFAWGNDGHLPKWLIEMVESPMCFRRNKNGSPKHPLYLSYKTNLIPFDCYSKNLPKTQESYSKANWQSLKSKRKVF